MITYRLATLFLEM